MNESSREESTQDFWEKEENEQMRGLCSRCTFRKYKCIELCKDCKESFFKYWGACYYTTRDRLFTVEIELELAKKGTLKHG